MSLKQTTQQTDYEKRAENFARVRALIMKILGDKSALTVEEVSAEFLIRYGFLPRIDNRLRELRNQLGWVESFEGEDGLLRWRKKVTE